MNKKEKNKALVRLFIVIVIASAMIWGIIVEDFIIYVSGAFLGCLVIWKAKYFS